MPESIAVIGLGCRYPDADSPRELWENALSQHRSFRRIPPERLNLAEYHHLDPTAPDLFYSPHAAVLADYAFDRLRHRVSGATFRAVDTTHWLAVDVAERALADSALGESFVEEHRDRIGVVVGNTLTGEFSRTAALRLRWPYVRRQVDAVLRRRGMDSADRAELLGELESGYKAPFEPIGEESLAGGLSNTIAGRVCNTFDLHGGAWTVDAACASSLLAVINAAEALGRGDADLMLAGGVDLSLDPFELVGFAKVGALAPRQMRVYDRDSEGFWPGEGCGFAVLARESDARRWGSRIYAVLRGWSVSSDGRGSITRPEQQGQALAVRRAYERAGYGPASVDLFEGHGTGTAVGDPIELATLSEARRGDGAHGAPAVIGSIKANIGHTKAAAGIAGLIKAIHAVHERTLPPITGCDTPHALLTGPEAQLRVLREPEPWPDRPARAGVSAMGFGGVNTHLTLAGEPAPRRLVPLVRQRALARTPQNAELIPFAAPDTRALAEEIDRLRAQTDHLSFGALRDLGIQRCTAGRAGQPVRAAIVAGTPFRLDEQLAQLRSWLDRGESTMDTETGVFLGLTPGSPRIGFLFPGQAAPVYSGGGVLGRRFPELGGTPGTTSGGTTSGDRADTALAQPAIVRDALAGVHALAALGIEAEAVLGHSIGELAALGWAGALDPAAAVELAALRGQVTAEHSPTGGAMAELATNAEAVVRLVEDLPVTIAALNAPDRIVIAGAEAAVTAACSRARARDIRATRLPVAHAFHSPLVAPVAQQFAGHLAEIRFARPRPGMISTVFGGELPAATELAPYLVEQFTSPVRFSAALSELAARVDLLLEVGPGHLLTDLAAAQTGILVLATDCGGENIRDFLNAVAAAHVLGAELDLSPLAAGRVQRSADPLRRPGFLANPCETATEEPPGEAAPVATPAPAARAPSTVDTEGDSFTVVRRLVAKHVELPEESLEPSHRMLADLRLNSITVAELAGLAARALGVAPPAVPTDLADASLAEFAEVLAQLPPADEEADTLPPGVADWTRAFEVRWHPIAVTACAPELNWTVLTEEGDPLAPALADAFPSGTGPPGILIRTRGARTHEAAHWLVRAVQQAMRSPLAHRIAVLHQGEAGGLGRTLALEQPGRPVRLIEIPATPSAEVLALAKAEAAQGHGFADRRIDAAGGITEPVLHPYPVPASSAAPLTGADVLLASGGGRGIGAESALALLAGSEAAVAVLGRADPAEDAELALTLARLGADGRRVRYLRADVTDADAVKHAMDEIATDLGPVTAVLHAAGTNHPQNLSTLDSEAVSGTLAPKVDGLRHILDAAEPGSLRLVITFGSIIGRVGLPGEGDYALANEWQRLEAQDAAERLPGCRFQHLEFSVWSEVGMGTRFNTLDRLARAGVAAIPPQIGTRLLRDLLAADPPLSLVVTGRFGSPPTANTGDRELPLTRFLERPRVHYPGVELVCDAEVTVPSDPYLARHALAGTCIMPGVVGLEAMAQAASGLHGPGVVTGFAEVELARPITVPADGGRLHRVAALDRPDGRYQVVVRGDDTGFAVDHFRALCAVAADFPPAPTANPAPLAGPPAELDISRDVYDRLLFHQDTLRRVRGYRELRARRCVVEIEAKSTVDFFGEFQPQQLLLGDPEARDAFIHALQAAIPHRRCLPERVESITRYRPLAGRLLVDAVETARDAETITVDLTARTLDGELCEAWTGLSLRAIGPLELTDWPPALLGPYLERRLDDLFGPGQVGLGVADNSEVAVARAAGRPVALRHHPDGRPLVDGTEVSVAHQGGLTLAVVAEGRVGCDLEAVQGRDRETWADLLGPQRLRVAEQIAADSAEDFDTAATRLWCAVESARKAGRTPGVPTIGPAEDGWLVLTLDGLRCATAVLTVRGQETPLVCAVLAPEVRP